MKTILVPTDFSAASKNAAIYAFGLAKQVCAKKIVLYNAYANEAPLFADPYYGTLEAIDIPTLKGNSVAGLNRLYEEIVGDCPDGTEIELLDSFGHFKDQIVVVCEETKADVIVLGIPGDGFLSENVFGSNSNFVARHSAVSVIIVPEGTVYKHVEKVLLVSDFVDVLSTTPYAPLKKILEATKPKFFVLHVADELRHSVPEESDEAFAFKKLFHSFDPELHFIISDDFAKAINDFVDANKIDITIVVPKKHGLLETVFKKSHTKELASKTHVPLVAVHEAKQN